MASHRGVILIWEVFPPQTHSFVPGPAIATVAQGEGIEVPLFPSLSPMPEMSFGYLLSCLHARRGLGGQPALPTANPTVNWRNPAYSWRLGLAFIT